MLTRAGSVEYFATMKAVIALVSGLRATFGGRRSVTHNA
ncbi:MAG: hypothetical protein JWO36_3776 [Myxococcales bacterium]|nr:hypothetical protein [Myxococcales bacterium]